MDSLYKHATEDIRREIENLLSSAGILCRVFGRGKSEDSLTKKINNSNGKYSIGGKCIQDSIGIRVAVYFSDDIETVHNLLSNKYNYRKNDSTIDKPAGDEFTVTRYNLIFDYPNNITPVEAKKRPIDSTFEVQIRSVLSEGWHEVEHDLRYKQKSYWENSDDLSRALNGIVATLETSEWGMRKIFDDLAYRHYKNRNWNAMVLLKLRMRLSGVMNDSLYQIFEKNQKLAKSLSRLNRSVVISEFANCKLKIPLSIDNAIYIWNKKTIKDSSVLSITPELINESI